MCDDPKDAAASTRLLNDALTADLAAVVILGVNADGTVYAEATPGNVRTLVWLIEQYKFEMLRLYSDGACSEASAP